MADADKKEEMDVDVPEEKPVEAEKADEEMKEKEVVEEPKEKEEDAPADSDTRYTGAIELSTIDATLNCLISEKNVLDAMPIDGTNFVATSRANIGLTGGRYLYEVEILATRGNGAEILVGFSCAGSSMFLGDKETLCFSSNGSYIVDGEKVNSFRGRRFGKEDTLGLLLNRTDSGNANTVSLFVNGERAGKPQEIPESFDGPLFPHVSVRLSTISVNFSKTQLKKLPFTVRLVGDANADDITSSTIKEATESKVVVPMGFDTAEYVQNYTDAHIGDHFVQITNASIGKWQEKSGIPKRALDHDSLRCLERMISLHKRNYIYSMSHNLLAIDRETLAKRFPATMKKVMVVCPSIISKLPFNTTFSKDVTLPTAEEGFTVEHTQGENKSKSALELWQKRCKQQTVVSDLKVGDYFKEQWGKWEKIRDATREDVDKKKKEAEEAEKKAAAAAAAAEAGEDKPAEETPAPAAAKVEKKDDDKKDEEKAKPSDVDCMLFTEEDWMLLDLRVELHLLIHAFREDVEDKDRVTFAADHLPHYYKLYHEGKKHFSLPVWGVKSVAECVEIISDTVDVEDGMLVAKHDRALNYDFIVQQTEDARQNRCDRIGAGDEGATLKFKATPKRQHQKGGHKGYKQGHNYKGNQSYMSKGGKDRNMKGSKPIGATGSQPMQRLPNQGPQGGPMGPKGGSKGKGPYPSYGGGGNNQMGGKGGKGMPGYQMRPVPQHGGGGGGGGGYKRPQGPGFQQSAAKRPY